MKRRLRKVLSHGLVLALAGAALPLLDCAAMDGATGGVELSDEECESQFGQGWTAGTLVTGDLPPECQDYFTAGTFDPCGELINQTCGPEDECGGTGDCAAARLMAEMSDATERCQQSIAADDLATCEVALPGIDCAALVQHTCGGPPLEHHPCGGDPACIQALLLHDDLNDLACREALDETSLYPRCNR